MKKLLLMFTLCAGAMFAQTATQKSEVFGGVGVAVTQNPATATKIQVGGGYGYNFTNTEALQLSYDYLPMSNDNAHTFLGTFKRSFAPKPFGSKQVSPFLSVGVGATDFQTSNVLKFTTRFGAGVSFPLKTLKGTALTVGTFGTKIDTLPVYFSTGIALSKSF